MELTRLPIRTLVTVPKKEKEWSATRVITICMAEDIAKDLLQMAEEGATITTAEEGAEQMQVILHFGKVMAFPIFLFPVTSMHGTCNMLVWQHKFLQVGDKVEVRIGTIVVLLATAVLALMVMVPVAVVEGLRGEKIYLVPVVPVDLVW